MSRYAGVVCWWAEPTELVKRSLRRYSRTGDPCPGPFGYHNASVDLPDVFGLERTEHGFRGDWSVPKTEDRWPTKCSFCDYVFTAEDPWQGSVTRVYRRADTHELVALAGPSGEGGQGPPGMLTHADWEHAREAADRGDGINLLAVCPNGAIWMVDHRASSGGYWERTGDPRNPSTLTVTPSIVAGDYHGFLQNGVFTDDIG